MELAVIALTIAQSTAGAGASKLALAGALGAVSALLGGYLVMRWLGRARLDAARNEAERQAAKAR